MTQRDFGGPLNSQYVTTLNVQAAGGDVVGGTYDMLFTSGPGSNPWANKWADATLAIDGKVNLAFNTGADNNITVVDGNYYTFILRDNGYNPTEVAVMATSAAPIEITAVDNDTLTPNITLSAAKSAEERVLIRYSSDAFATSDVVEATGSGTSYSATIPDPGAGNSVVYYALTTTISDDATFLTDPDIFTIAFDNNGGANYVFGIPNPTATITAQGGDPTNATTVVFDVVFDAPVDGVTAGAFAVDVTGTVTGTIGSVTGADGDTDYTVEVTGVGGDGTLAVDLAVTTGITDSGTNTKEALAVQGTPVTIDNTPPTVVMITPLPDPTGTKPVPVKAQFSEPVTGFDSSDIVPGAGVTVQNFTALSAYDYLFELERVGSGILSAEIPAGAGQDAAGNGNDAAVPFSIEHDNTLTDPDNTFNGVAVYVTGDNPPLDGFSPGSDPLLQLRDDGTNGDAVAGDGTYSVEFVPSTGNGVDRRLWKAASPTFSPVSIPSGTENSQLRAEAGVPVTFVLETNTKNDGFVPDVDGNFIQGYLYTIPAPILATDAIRATGNYLSEVGGTDWDASDDTGRLYDDGTNGDDVAGDDLFTNVFTGITPGTYEFKITSNGGYDFSAGPLGYSTAGDNLELTVIDVTDTITIVFDRATGRTSVSNDNPLANPGPPFFAISAAWGTALDNDTMLYDDGTNGDVTAGDGIYSREFEVLNPTTDPVYRVRINQFVGPAYPNTGGYPFIATVGQNVLVQFDTNEPNDGFVPTTRYVWTDPDSRRVPSYVQAVGDFREDFGGASDFNNDDALFELFDTGADGDAVAGDGVFAREFFSPGVTDRGFKALAEQASWDYQYGGQGDGATYLGNNPTINLTASGAVVLQADSVTGRVKVGSGLPNRPATIDAPASTSSSVGDWQLFDY